MIFSDAVFPEDKTLVFYGIGGYAEDFVRKHCLENGRIRLPDYFVDDREHGDGEEFFGKPIRQWADIAREHSAGELIIVVMALAGGNLAIPGRNARDWDFADVRIGRCLDMRFELEEREKTGRIEKVRRLLGDARSREVFDFVTSGVADGAIWCRNIYAPNLYFGNDVITEIRTGEVYIDAGANRGEDMLRLAGMNSEYGRMIGFEPDGRVFGELARVFPDERVTVRRQGLSDHNGRAAFDAGGACGRLLTDADGDGRDCVEVVRLDDCGIGGVSLIKMDVEGGEAAALLGAERVIKENRPRLAISAYHKVSDLFRLPEIILGLRPDYRLYLRHHSVFMGGTVLYAV